VGAGEGQHLPHPASEGHLKKLLCRRQVSQMKSLCQPLTPPRRPNFIPLHFYILLKLSDSSRRLIYLLLLAPFRTRAFRNLILRLGDFMTKIDWILKSR